MDDARIVTIEEVAALRAGRDCALVVHLWAKGTIEALVRPTVGIVGTRAATAYGKRIARAFAAELGRAGCCIVSGLALGIDSAAHEGALEACAPTIGVLGSGHNRFFPTRNVGLASRMIAQGGAVLSPFPPEQPAFPYQFLQRNGVVAALCDAVVVIEAPARSGALNTANWAAGRIPVFAVPGDVDRAHVAGCHALIRDGAVLARDATDVLEALSIPQSSQPTFGRVVAKEPDRSLRGAVLAHLECEDSDLESLAAATGASAPDLLAMLGMLELEGAIECSAGRFASLLS
ncbi:MAG: DNA-protecting protein DprA [Candidatus Eremiobacteraeota bacterium]|nr:DNA-protecting protein DprA [Candidatus Eremiobacteraeota bacterium]